VALAVHAAALGRLALADAVRIGDAAPHRAALPFLGRQGAAHTGAGAGRVAADAVGAEARAALLRAVTRRSQPLLAGRVTHAVVRDGVRLDRNARIRRVGRGIPHRPAAAAPGPGF